MGINTKIRKMFYHIKYQYPTREVAMVAGIALITIWFMWGSVLAMQKNYELKKTVEAKERQAKLSDLETKMLEYEQRYLNSEEYKKLAVREHLGYGDPGEKLMILPPNTPGLDKDEPTSPAGEVASDEKPSNISQWANFLFGGNVREG
jgi:hypothetical protein